jgi:hypothetical protein
MKPSETAKALQKQLDINPDLEGGTIYLDKDGNPAFAHVLGKMVVTEAKLEPKKCPYCDRILDKETGEENWCWSCAEDLDNE